jgi:predicted short-subunit dehydrogenase-like oxidoreductase (DUF2520 family)
MGAECLPVRCTQTGRKSVSLRVHVRGHLFRIQGVPFFLTCSVSAAILGYFMTACASERQKTEDRRPKTGAGNSGSRSRASKARTASIAVRHWPRRPLSNSAFPATRKRVGFIGAGRTGCALAWHCNRLGYPIAGVTDSKPKQAWVIYGLMKRQYERLSSREVAAASDVLFLTVPDTHIGPVFESVRRWLVPGAIVAHCSGAFGPEVFGHAQEQGLGVLALHPVQSFSSHSQAMRSLPGSFFAADGSASGIRFARHLVRQLHGGWVRVSSADRSLYHAMCVFASNSVCALFDAVEEIARELGISRRRAGSMLAPLARTVLDNIAEQGAASSLTGPVERGDALTVAAHLQALRKRAPALVPMYRVISERLVEMAARSGLDKAAVRKLKAALEE